MNRSWNARISAMVLLLSVSLATCLTGCSRMDATKAASAIHAYLPAVMGLAQDAAQIVAALDSTDAAQIQAVNTRVQAGLKELETLSGNYVTSPSSETWAQLETVVDALVSDTDQELLAALAIKNSQSQAEAKVVLSALDAGMHVLDSYLLAARTTTEVKTAADQRVVKLQSVARYWSVADRQRVEQASGARFDDLYAAETRLGF